MHSVRFDMKWSGLLGVDTYLVAGHPGTVSAFFSGYNLRFLQNGVTFFLWTRHEVVEAQKYMTFFATKEESTYHSWIQSCRVATELRQTLSR